MEIALEGSVILHKYLEIEIKRDINILHAFGEPMFRRVHVYPIIQMPQMPYDI